MITVITYGTFDLFHVGHVRLLRRARALGGRLLVGISTDQFNVRKGKRAVNSFEDRCEIVSSCEYVDDVFAENDWEQKALDITKYKADLFVMGDDWLGKFDSLKELCAVHYLSRTDGISTTDLRKLVATREGEGVAR